MTSKEKEYKIYKEVARILDELQIVYGVSNLYETMCSYLNVSRYIQNLRVFCSDIDKDKVERLIRLKNLSLEELREELSKLVSKFVSNTEDIYELYEYLFLIYKLAYNNEKYITMEDMIKYNENIHTERFSDFTTKLGNILIECSNYKELAVKNNSFIILYPPFMKKNILDETFNHREMIKWVERMLEEQDKNIHVFILAKELSDDFVIYTDFSDKVKLNKKDKNNLKLFVHKNSMLANYDDNNLSDIDF